MERPAASRYLSRCRRRPARRRSRDHHCGQRIDRRRPPVASGRRYPWVQLVALAENRGFAGGNNAGAREARGRFVAFLNNDTSPDPGWLRALLAGIDEPAGFALATSRIVYMHDPRRHRQCRRRHAAMGRRVSSDTTANRHPWRRVDRRSVRRLRRRVPDAEGGVRRNWRLRRRFLRVARGRGSVVSRAAARVPVPVRGRRGRPPRRQRDARHREPGFGVPRTAKPRVDVHQGHAGSLCSGKRCPVISCTTSPQECISRGSACCAHSCAPRLRRSEGCHARYASAPPFSGRGASLRPRSSRCSTRGGLP